MKKVFTLLCFLSFFYCARASVNFWTGSEAVPPDWSNASNWANGLPTVNDTVFFDNVTANVNVDVAPNIAGLQIINNSNVIFSSSGNTLVTIGNLNQSGLLVFFISAGSSLTIQGAIPTKGVSIQTYGNFTTTRAIVDGTFIFGDYTSTWNVNSFPASFCTTNINGTVRVTAANTGSVMNGGISNGNAGTITFANGSLLDWQRSGGSAPNADYANGSVINVSGIAGTNMSFNSSAKFNGLLIWNCPLQTVSGSSAILLPASNIAMDSVRIVSTGSGSVRMSTNPNGYIINTLEVNGGILELAASNSGSNNLTDTIVNEFKIAGGTVYGNATFNFDNLGSAYPNTLFVRGAFTMTGGTLDFTNRNAGNAPGGAFSMSVGGNILQTGGRIKATKGFDAQNLLTLNGFVQQNLSLSNITDTITLVVNNVAGASLQSNLLLPYKLQLQSGYLQLNQYTATVAASRITQAIANPTPCIVTNDVNGRLVITNVTGSQLFPVAPFAGGYNPVTINNTAAANTYSAGVEYGLRSTASLDVLKMINRTWHITSSVPGTNGNTLLIFQYSDSEKVEGSTIDPSGLMLLGHKTLQWNYDPNVEVLPTGGPVNYTVGPYAPSTIDSFYSIGNTGFINAITTTYTFTGTGNWDVPGNWSNNTIPPNPLPAGSEIVIDPSSGSCILNISQAISPGASIKVNSNKSFLIPGNLTVQ